jgi:atypical dual specificity phosphatase
MPLWWIEESHILGCRNPTDAELEILFQQGFMTIISLLDENEQPPYYDVKKTKAKGFKRYAIPVGDFTAPTQAQFKEFLDIIKQTEGKVIIHCQGGSGRTGTMGAAYWISKGMPAHKAIDKVRRTNPRAVEEPVQENSLYQLQAVVMQRSSFTCIS